MAQSLSQKLNDALPRAVLFAGICFRNVPQQFAHRNLILSAFGSFIAGGRFNFKGTFEVLYLSCDVHTCLEETIKSSQRDEFQVALALPRTVVGVDAALSLVLNLTDDRQRRRLGVTKAQLIQTDWETIQEVDKREAVTQEVGRLARDAGFEALLVPSAATPSGKNLAVFPDKLLSSSWLSVVNQDRLPPV